ncbi:MAG: DUF465 domain-containing protein [Pseudomonadota bacterium]
MNVMSEEETLQVELAELRRRHRALDDEIADMGNHLGSDALRLRRLKKEKLTLKDRISRIEDQLYPDIIA